MDTEQTPSLTNWDIRHAGQVDRIPWGSQGNARAKILGQADGYIVALIEADAGYQTSPPEHAHAEFFYPLSGVITNQGQVLSTGDAYAAAIGSTHTDFEVQAPSTYPARPRPAHFARYERVGRAASAPGFRPIARVAGRVMRLLLRPAADH